jgi:hypothetical protein
MAGSLLVGAEGVILIPNQKAYGSSRPIDEGLELISKLMAFPTTRTAVLVEIEDADVASYWLKVHGLPKTSAIVIPPEDRHVDNDLAQWYSIERERSKGPVDLVVTAWYSVYERCSNSHQPVVLFGRRGAIGSLDASPSWDELHQRIIRNRDARVEEPDDIDEYGEPNPVSD